MDPGAVLWFLGYQRAYSAFRAVLAARQAQHDHAPLLGTEPQRVQPAAQAPPQQRLVDAHRAPLLIIVSSSDYSADNSGLLGEYETLQAPGHAAVPVPEHRDDGRVAALRERVPAAGLLQFR